MWGLHWGRARGRQVRDTSGSPGERRRWRRLEEGRWKWDEVDEFSLYFWRRISKTCNGLDGRQEDEGEDGHKDDPPVSGWRDWMK